MITRSITVDFSKKTGKFKPINCLNNGPRFGYDLELDLTEKYKEMSPPYIRVSGVEAPYSSSRYLDIHCIFPDMALDERFQASYNFAPTDRLLASVHETGAEIFLRLGESRESHEVKKYTRPPRDKAKIARICERIIAHYNKGWANGFKYNIKYVEIMCDADSPDAFLGSPRTYYSLYATVANHLKSVYPKLRVGAYSSGGFRSLNHYGSQPEVKGYIPFLEDFLTYITSIERAPLDFFSWKCYADEPIELDLHANYAKSYLAQYGCKKTQSIVTEFNLLDTPSAFTSRSYPARLACSYIIAHKSDIDMMFLSHLHPDSEWNPLYSRENRRDVHLYSAYHVMTALGVLTKLGNTVESTGDFRRELYSLAAADDKMGALVFATADYSGKVDIILEGRSCSSYSIKGIIGGGERGSGFFTEEKGLAVRDGKISLRVGKNEVYFLKFV